MNSSTFSSNVKAVLLALTLLLSAELGMRWLEPHLSLDVSHIRDIPWIVSQLADGPGEHLLFLGNSMTRKGIDKAVLGSALAARGVATDELSVGLVYPDASDILDWGYVYGHYLDTPATQPGVMVVSFAYNDLQDASPNPQQVRRVARHHTSWRDLPEVFAQDFTTASQRGDYLISKVSASFAHRERVRVRALDALVPFYRETERGLNDQPPTATQPSGQPPARYTRLKRFLEAVDPDAVRVIFVAMPLRDPYRFDPRVATILQEEGAELINLQSVPGLTSTMFEDNLHLSPQGAALYSRALARKLAPLLTAGDGSSPN